MLSFVNIRLNQHLTDEVWLLEKEAYDISPFPAGFCELDQLDLEETGANAAGNRYSKEFIIARLPGDARRKCKTPARDNPPAPYPRRIYIVR